MVRKLLLILGFALSITFVLLTSNPDKISAGSCSWNGSVSANWNVAANWGAGCTGAGGIPGTGDNITFPGGASNTGNNNNISSLNLGSITISGASYVLGGNAITLNSGVTSTQSGAIVNIGISLGANQNFGPAIYSGTITNNNRTLGFDGATGDIHVPGNITGNGIINVGGTNTITFSGNDSGYIGLVNLNGGTFVVNGDIGNSTFALYAGTLSGSGTVGDLTAFNATVDPGGVSPALLSVSGDILWDSTSTAIFDINGESVLGTDYDSVHFTGTADLGGAALIVHVNYAPTIGDTVTLVGGVGLLTGTFAGQPNLSTVTADGYEFIIHYEANYVYLENIASLHYDGLTTSASPTAGSPITLTATWSGTNGVPTGTITFKEGSTVLGTTALSGGIGSIVVSSLMAGTHAITVQYGGNGTYGGAISGPTDVVVAAAPGAPTATPTFTATPAATATPAPGTTALARTGVVIPIEILAAIALAALGLFQALQEYELKSS